MFGCLSSWDTSRNGLLAKDQANPRSTVSPHPECTLECSAQIRWKMWLSIAL
jgi:hypothetical protein